MAKNPLRFQYSSVIETGLSDFHKMVITIRETIFTKLTPKVINYRDYKMFSNDNFRQKILTELSMENISVNYKGLEKFLQLCIRLLVVRKSTFEEIICFL